MADRVVVKNVSALEAFAGQLGRAKSSLEQVGAQLQSAMAQVGGQWEDPQKDRCAQEIEQMRRQIRAFAQTADQQMAYCKRLAAHLRSLPTS